MNHNRIENHVGPAADGNGQTMSAALEAAKPMMEKVSDAVSSTIRERPITGIAVGLAIGVALGWLIKRQ